MQLAARKSLGQHFLIDPAIHHRIVKAAAVKPGDSFIEIGPGTGLLTTALLRTPLKRLTAFELDERAVPELRTMFEGEGDRFVIVEEDFLQVDLAKYSANAGEKIRVIGNIPYYITSPILFKLLEAREVVKDAVLLVQLEVGERLGAKPRTKEYGIPTVLANFFGEVEFLFKVKAGSFRPAPKVDSAVVRIDLERGYFARTGIERPQGFVDGNFQTFVRQLFRMRRKTIRNNLKGLVSTEAIEGLGAQAVGAIYLKQRAEELTIPELIDLFSLSHGLPTA
jgi:16S rRNA (adenine1518-N6/adenine1519-N6)-dimethyltransferase